jgi:hypothetical protein
MKNEGKFKYIRRYCKVIGKKQARNCWVIIKKHKTIFFGILVVVFVMTMWGSSWYILTHSEVLKSWSDRGTFGDMFGAINALFSGLAFSGVIITIMLQTHELKLQRDELAETRKEVKLQRIQLEEQNKRSREQTTASILFELTKIYSEEKISEAVYYLKKVWADHDQEFKKNRYAFARKYLNTIEIGSPEWRMRKSVSSFFGDMGAIVESGLIDEDVIFSSYGPDDIAIIEFLEPIETIIKEKYYPSTLKKENILLRFLHLSKEWQMKKEKVTCSEFSFPKDPDLYEKSLGIK